MWANEDKGSPNRIAIFAMPTARIFRCLVEQRNGPNLLDAASSVAFRPIVITRNGTRILVISEIARRVVRYARSGLRNVDIPAIPFAIRRSW